MPTTFLRRVFPLRILSKLPHFGVLLSLMTLSFVVNFFYFRHWGIYEDDYIWVFTLPPLNWTFPDFIRNLELIWRQWVIYQCRPLGFSLNIILAYGGSFFSAIGPSYLVGFAVLASNAVLLFLNSIDRFGRRLAWVAAVAFLSFPADASKQILMHRMLHLSETFLLLALFLYQRRHFVWAYAIASLTFLTYESLYLPFIIAPFLAPTGLSRRELIRHGALCSAIAALALLARSLFGDSRAQLMTGGLPVMAWRMAMACVIGFESTLSTALKSPVIAIASLSKLEAVPVVLAIFIVLVPFLLMSKNAAERVPPRRSSTVAALRVIAFAAAIAFSYILAFRPENFPPSITIGRLSGVNVAAAVPFGLFVASVDALMCSLLARTGRTICSVILMFFICGWSVYGVHMQRSEYTANWQLQQKPLWQLLLSKSAAFGEGTVVLVEMDSFPRTSGFVADGFVGGKAFGALAEFVAYPNDWAAPPRVFGFSATTPLNPSGDGFVLHSPSWTPQLWPTLTNNSFYVIVFKNGGFEFSSTPIRIQGIVLQPRRLRADPSLQQAGPPLRRAGLILFGGKPP
jgi:hypothetical protein